MSETPIPAATVESASTTRLFDGRVVLLVRTEAGPGRLVFPASLARQLFVVTNPVTVATARTADKRPDLPPQTRTSKSRLSPERLALYQRIEQEALADPLYGAFKRACTRAGVNYVSFHSWRYNRQAQQRARCPIPKPSGSLL